MHTKLLLHLNPTSVLSFALLAVASSLSLAPSLRAQNIVLSEYNGKAYQVISAHRQFPEVEVAGKRVNGDVGRLALRPTDEYQPVFISISKAEGSVSHLNASGASLNNEYHFRARFETAYALTNVFLVLELNNELSGKQLFLYELGDLEPHVFKSLTLTVPLQFPMGKGRHKTHLFSNGMEVLHSEMPEDYRAAVLDRMIKKRILTVQDADPAPFIGPVPEYPPSLLKAKTKGQAIITIQVGANGRISDPVIKSATDRAFGENALEAVRQWRFLPRVTNGRAVASQVDMPFDFAPPEKS